MKELTMVDVASAAIELAEYGLYPIRLHRPIGDGCSCGRSDCGDSAGKHPVAVQWARSVTQDIDVLDEMFQGDWNVGILLGPGHGIPVEQAIIDIENDSEEGAALADDLFAGLAAPCFKSNKSIHRLFRWSPGLPDQATFRVHGLEFRLGGHGKETQSVAPPSMHRSGVRYEWLPGMGLGDLRIPELPDEVMARINNLYLESRSGRTRLTASSRRKLAGKETGVLVPGERHPALLTWMNRKWREVASLHGLVGFDDADATDQLWLELCGVNSYLCKPPKSEQQLTTLFDSTREFMRNEISEEMVHRYGRTSGLTMQPAAATEQTVPESTSPVGELIVVPSERALDIRASLGDWLHYHQIQIVMDPTLKPEEQSCMRVDAVQGSGWSLALIKGADNKFVELTVPLMEQPCIIPYEILEKPSLIANKLQIESRGKIRLDATFAMWSWKTLWLGKKNGKSDGVTRGLLEYLTSTAVVKDEQEVVVADQIMDIVDTMCGDIQAMLPALEQYETQIAGKHSGRIQVDVFGALTRYAPPNAPQTGWYRTSEGVVQAVKLKEVVMEFRKSYGNKLQTNEVSDTLKHLGFEHKNKQAKCLPGKWWIKTVE